MLTRDKKSLRYRLSGLFDDDAPRTLAVRIFNIALATLIIVNVLAVVLKSVAWLNNRYAITFLTIERVATAIFALEYVLRVWTAVDYRSGKFRDPVWGRLNYMRGFFPLIDLVAVLPALLGFFGAVDLRVLRLLRLLRMIKLTRHSHVFSLLWAVLREEARAIAALIFVLFLTLTHQRRIDVHDRGRCPAGRLHFDPRRACGGRSRPITTVGYGDMVPVTTVGRILGGIVSVVGIGTLALFSGLITAGYLNQLRLRRERAHHHK